MKWVNSRNGFDYDDSTINVVDVLLLLRFVADRARNSGDTLADRQTGEHADTRTDTLVTSTRLPQRGQSKNSNAPKNGALIRQF